MDTAIKLKVEVYIDAPVANVWEAITTPEIIKKYFFGTDVHTDWKPGNPVTFTGIWKEKEYEDKGTVLENEPNQLLSYDYWSSLSGMEDKPENYMTISYELHPDRDGTDLILTQENIPDEQSKIHSEENWKNVLEQLKTLVESQGSLTNS